MEKKDTCFKILKLCVDCKHSKCVDSHWYCLHPHIFSPVDGSPILCVVARSQAPCIDMGLCYEKK